MGGRETEKKTKIILNLFIAIIIYGNDMKLPRIICY